MIHYRKKSSTEKDTCFPSAKAMIQEKISKTLQYTSTDPTAQHVAGTILIVSYNFLLLQVPYSTFHHFIPS